MEEHLRSGNTGIRHRSDVVPDTQEQGGTECCEASSPFFGRACILGVMAPPLPVGKKLSSIAFVLEMGKLFY